MEDLTGKQFNALTVLGPSEKRVNRRKTWRCQCECGNIVDVITSNLTSGHTKSCGCYNSRGRMIDITNQRFGSLVALHPTDKRSGTSVIWECQCDCGNITEVSSFHLRKGTIKSCGCYRQELARQKGKAQASNLLNQRFGYLTVIEAIEDERDGQYWKCKCDCGNIVIHNTNDLNTGHCISCGCAKQSKCELYIAQILNELNIEYISEYTYTDCLSPLGYKLRFDFYLPQLNILIEYDGIQHSKPTFGDEALQKQQEYDNIKTDYCKTHNIPLIRINHTYDTKDAIKTVITRAVLAKE